MISAGAVQADPRTELLRLLVVEDNPGDVALVRALRHDAGPGHYAIDHVVRVSEAVDHLLDGVYDCVLLELSLPDASGLDALDQLRTAALDVPVVVLSGRRDEQLAVGAVQEGAQDRLIKGEVDGRLLARSITYAIERKRAEVDPYRAQPRGGAVLFCDVDRFKIVNDSLGHEVLGYGRWRRASRRSRTSSG